MTEGIYNMDEYRSTERTTDIQILAEEIIRICTPFAKNQ